MNANVFALQILSKMQLCLLGGVMCGGQGYHFGLFLSKSTVCLFLDTAGFASHRGTETFFSWLLVHQTCLTSIKKAFCFLGMSSHWNVCVNVFWASCSARTVELVIVCFCPKRTFLNHFQ